MQRFVGNKKYYKLAQIYTIWEFCYRLLPLYLWTHVWEENRDQYPPQPKENQSNWKEENYFKYDD